MPICATPVTVPEILSDRAGNQMFFKNSFNKNFGRTKRGKVPSVRARSMHTAHLPGSGPSDWPTGSWPRRPKSISQRTADGRAIYTFLEVSVRNLRSFQYVLSTQRFVSSCFFNNSAFCLGEIGSGQSSNQRNRVAETRRFKEKTTRRANRPGDPGIALTIRSVRNVPQARAVFFRVSFSAVSSVLIPDASQKLVTRSAFLASNDTGMMASSPTA